MFKQLVKELVKVKWFGWRKITSILLSCLCFWFKVMSSFIRSENMLTRLNFAFYFVAVIAIAKFEWWAQESKLLFFMLIHDRYFWWLYLGSVVKWYLFLFFSKICPSVHHFHHCCHSIVFTHSNPAISNLARPKILILCIKNVCIVF